MSIVSVIIPAYNRARVIRRALESVCTQSFRDLEILVIDDGSSDRTCEIVEAVGDPRIRLFQTAVNHGSGAARNAGLRAATGKYIAFLDSDDEWLPGKLEKQVALMESLPADWTICHTGAQLLKDGVREAWFRPDPRRSGDVFRDFVFGRIPFLTPTLMIRRAILPAVGEFDERLRRGQDVEFLLRVFRQGKLAVLPEPLVRVYLETGKPLATAVEHSRQTLCEKHLVTVRRELGWYAARFFRADNLWLIAEACFREGQLLSGAKYWAQALAATPFMPLSRYVRILLAACGLLPYLKRLAARWQHVVRTPAARPGHS